MKIAEALSLLAKLWELESIAQTATTPDGRWQLLQDWLSDNPTWEKQINLWAEHHPESAFLCLRDYVADQAGIPILTLNAFITIGIKQRVINAINTIQTLYKERRQLRKEIAQ